MQAANSDYVHPEKRKLAITIIEEHFGDLVATVARTIVRYGELCLADIIRFTKFVAARKGLTVQSKAVDPKISPTQKIRFIQRSLRVLQQHGMLLVKEENKRLVYDLLLDNAIHRMSFATYTVHIKKRYSLAPSAGVTAVDPVDAELVAETVIKHGFLHRTEVVTHALASAVLLGGKRRHGGEEVRAQLVVAFEALCRDGYLELVPHQAQLAAPGAVAASSSVEAAARPSKRQRVGSPAASDSAASDLHDAKDFWRMNYEQVRRDMTYEQCERLVAAKHSEEHAQLVQIMLRLARQSLEHETDGALVAEGLSAAIEVEQLYKKLPVESELSQADMHKMLDEMYRDKLELLSPANGFFGGAAYHVNLRNLCSAVTRHTVETIVSNRLGVIGARMYRMLLIRLKLEQKQLEKAAMVPMKEARIALYRMVNLGYIRVQEVPKSADYNPKNTIYIFEAKIEETLRVMIDDLLKTIHNMKRRLLFETNENGDLFSTKNSSARPTEDQKNRMLTFQLKYDALENSALRLNDTLMSLHYLQQ